LQQKPNILWIQTDEQRPDSLGCYGSRWAKTPNIDGLAEKGVVMKNAVCQSPVCLPSRSSQLSARYPHEFACLNNMLKTAGETFPEGYRTFPQIFQQAGYETVNYGRYHALSQDVFETNRVTKDAMPEYCSVFGLNKKYNEEEYHVVKRPGKHHRPLIIAGTYPGEENPCQISTDRAIEFLQRRQPNDRPFFLRVSYNWPHTPTLAPPPYDKYYDPDALPIQYYDEEVYTGRSQFDRTYADLHGMKDLTKEQVRQVWKDYMGLCAYVDSEVGRLLSILDEMKLQENTIILYSSDHGKSLGEWGAGEKGNFDQEVWRVPFIWSWPHRIPENQVWENGCELMDTARTMMTLAGLEEQIPDSYRGRNLFGNDEQAEAVFGVTRPPIDDIPDYDPRFMRVGILTAQYRMDMNWFMDGTRPSRESGDGNLFDLVSDPEEKHNLWNDDSSEQVVHELMDKIAEWLRNYPSDARLCDPNNAGILF
jgi:choline-sulfatase